MLKLTATIRAILDWSEIDTNEVISTQTDLGEESDEITFAYGTGIGQVNEAWYEEFTLPANSGQVVDLSSLPVDILGVTINREIHTLKTLVIENLNSSGNLIVGNSGISEGINFLGEACDIGYSGVYEMVTNMGVEITTSKHRFHLINNNEFEINCKVLVLGVYNA